MMVSLRSYAEEITTETTVYNLLVIYRISLYIENVPVLASCFVG